MYSKRREPFPVEVVRDLLGIVRSLYAVALIDGDETSMRTLRDVGASLNLALDMGQRCEPESIGHANAWGRAESAFETLSALPGVSRPASELLEVTKQRVSKARTG